MIITKEKLEEIKKYIDDNFCDLWDEDEEDDVEETPAVTSSQVFYNYLNCSLCDDIDDLKNKINKRVGKTWQESLFSIIDNKLLDEVEVYKRAGISKQVFSKIRGDVNCHPNKDTAISLCIGLKLNLDEAQDLLKKAGYSLSSGIKRDLIIIYFIENHEYDIITINIALDKFSYKPFTK